MTDDRADDRAADLEYVGLMALAWDPLRGDTSGWEDRAFYLDLIRERGEPVLDVGCGTGRLLLDYLALGIDVDGVEISADMLAICRSKAEAAGLDVDGRLFEQAMEAMDLPRRYRTIIVPSSSFQLVVDPIAAAEALRRFHAHLLPGGTLALPFYALAEAADESWTDEADLADGSRIRRTSRSWVEAGTRLEHTEDTYELLRDGVVVETQRQVRSPAVRGYAPDDARAALEAAGFVDLAFYREFTREPLRDGERLYSVVARRPT
jgi:SAM-dependent methyltransferase